MLVVVSRRALQLAVLTFLVGATSAAAVDPPVRDGRPMNIVLIIADDLRWADLPMFGTPVVWEDQNDPLDLSAFPMTPANDAWGEYREANWRRPELNRLAARIMANNPDGSLGGMTDEDPLVVPADLDSIENTTAADFRYTVRASNSSRDVLSGFGGLGLLAREGVVMPRFYANSAKCAPSRAALLTGRHQQRAGVLDNGKHLDPKYVTFAELLKQGCAEGDPHTCYHTGWFGKWNPGASKGNDPWRQGFDEYIGFENSKRKYFSTEAEYCSPVLSAEEDPATPQPTKFCQTTRVTTCEDDDDCENEPHDAKTCSDHGVCFNPWPWPPCETSTECGTSAVCRSAARYVGKRPWLACSPADATRSLDCCVPSSNHARRGKFSFTSRNVFLDGAYHPVTFTPNACDVDDDIADGPYELRALRPPHQACLFSDRMVRDWARNFLIRRLYDDADDRFLLVVAPKAPHVGLDAPDRTAAHYKTASLPIDRPGTNADADYWALVEELDALVGTLVKLIDGMCDTSSGDFVGNDCTSNAQCGAGTCVSRRDNTLILFTDDNGGAASGWGQPDLAGAKETVWEGGIRVGLVARGPGVGVGLWTDGLTGWQSQRENATSASIGSLVDIFPTIAQAAGYGLTPNGSIDISTCSRDGSGDERGEFCDANVDCEGFCQHVCRNTGTLCTTNDDCAGEECLQNSAKRCSNTGRSCQNDEACSPDCDPYPIDGRSLIPVLNGSAEGSAYQWEQPFRAYRREFTYSTFTANPSLAVSGREGYFKQCDTIPEGGDGVLNTQDTQEADACSLATHVCAYDAPVLAAGAATQESRHHHASSCIACKPGAAPGALGSCKSESDVANQRCEVIGGVCVRDDDPNKPYCVDKSATGADLFNPSDCGLPEARRCRDATDCPEHWTCSGEVAVKCQTCSPAAWKALGGVVNGVRVVSHLLDLASNPEEDLKKLANDTVSNVAAYGTDGHLNCAANNIGSLNGALTETRLALLERLDDWQTCVTGQDEQNGDNCHEPQ